MKPRAPCPFLPLADGDLSQDTLRILGQERTVAAFLAFLRSSQALWLAGRLSRAIDFLFQSLAMQPDPESEEAGDCPPPFTALVWMVSQSDPETLPRNLRHHLFDLALKYREKRATEMCWRTWACWWLVSQLLPEKESDGQTGMEGPTEAMISDQLKHFNWPGEMAVWAQAKDMVAPALPPAPEEKKT